MMPINDQVYRFFTEEGEKYSQFDILFTRKHIEVYTAVREMLKIKWTNKSDYSHEKLCNVCMLQEEFKNSINISLLYLFYSCSTITRTTILDALVSLCMTYGWNNCKLISPKDIYFHFFLNHCHTPVVPGTGFSSHANFVCSVMNDLIFDCANIDNILEYICNNVSNVSKCNCNSCHSKLAITSVNEEDEEEEETVVFIPKHMKQTNTILRCDNSYKWSTQNWNIDNIPSDTLLVNCFKVFSDCPICDSMMDFSFRDKFVVIDQAILSNTKCNIETAIQKVCKDNKFTEDQVQYLITHYTSSTCKLNTLKYINFYSLIKQISSLNSNDFVEHITTQLFQYKSSFLCPLYHLTCLCEIIVESDKSQLRKTSRNKIGKWAASFRSIHKSS